MLLVLGFVGCGDQVNVDGLDAVESALRTVVPDDGIYRVTELAVPTTAHSCQFGDEAGSFFPDVRVAYQGDGVFTRDYLYPGTDESICVPPNVCAGLTCVMQGNKATCGESGGLEVDFGFLGFDAIVTFGAPFNGGNSSRQIWPRSNRWMDHSSSFLTCAGTDCPIMATFFGPDFSFPCGDVTSVTRYDLEP